MKQQTPVDRACTVLWLIAIVTLLMGLMASAPLAFSLFIGRAKFGPGNIIYFLLCAIAFVMPPILYFIAAIYLRRRKTWAAIMGIVVGAMHALAGLIVVAGAIYALTVVGAFMFVPMSAALVLMILSSAGIVACAKALRHIQDLSTHQAGFTPIMQSKP